MVIMMFFIPIVINFPNWEIVIINRWGNEIVKLNESNQTWDGHNVENGIYYYIFKCNELNKFEQGCISVFR